MKESKITVTFNKLKEENKKAFIPYIMAGDPSLEKTKEIVLLLEECGADIVELGVPFTDPLADGPVIQRAAERSLKKRVTLRRVIKTVSLIRKKTDIPIVLMTYFNPIFKYGTELFINDAYNAGVNGVIIPDLPPDEERGFIELSHNTGLDTIYLLAPNSTEDRIELVTRVSTGFIYYVSLTGITGSKIKINTLMRGMINKIKSVTEKPVAVGFGVKNYRDAKEISKMADGIIVGSSIVKMIHENYDGLEKHLKSLRKAI